MRAEPAAASDPHDSAKAAGLRYVNDERLPGIRRLGTVGRFTYVGPDGRRIASEAERQRIRSLVIPPAWRDIWICPIVNGHIQATGRDARGRKQYRYHPRWRDVRDEVKYGRMIAFARALPKIRARVAADLRRPGLPREKVLATVVQLLEKTLIRIGNEEYARANGAIGLTTMRDAHAKIQGGTVRFEFRGKSGVQHAIDLHDPRLARVVKACRDLPGYELFQWVDADGARQTIDSADVNAYLREAMGADFTAKDFRTWAGTVMAARELGSAPKWQTVAQARRQIVKAVEAVSKRLGNTKAVCRRSYVHPAIFDSFMEATPALSACAATTLRDRARSAALSADERAVLALLCVRLRAASSLRSTRLRRTA